MKTLRNVRFLSSGSSSLVILNCLGYVSSYSNYFWWFAKKNKRTNYFWIKLNILSHFRLEMSLEVFLTKNNNIWLMFKWIFWSLVPVSSSIPRGANWRLVMRIIRGVTRSFRPGYELPGMKSFRGGLSSPSFSHRLHLFYEKFHWHWLILLF